MLGASTTAPGRTDGVTRECALLPSDGQTFMLLTVVHEPERDQEVSLNVSGKPLGHKVPDLCFTKRESEVQAHRMAAVWPTEITPGHESQGDRIREPT